LSSASSSAAPSFSTIAGWLAGKLEALGDEHWVVRTYSAFLIPFMATIAAVDEDALDCLKDLWACVTGKPSQDGTY